MSVRYPITNKRLKKEKKPLFGKDLSGGRLEVSKLVNLSIRSHSLLISELVGELEQDSLVVDLNLIIENA